MEATTFHEHMWDFNKYGFTMISIAFGNDLGLFDLIIKENRKLTSQEIADLASMKERYVREWLGCMVAAKIVTIEDDKYFIPEEYHDTVRAASSWATSFLIWANRWDPTKRAFSKSGPWGNEIYDTDDSLWKNYGGFRELTGEELFKKAILPVFDEFPDLKSRLESGGKVLDIGCGTGIFSRQFAKQYPNSRIVASDATDKALGLASEHPEVKDLANIRFVKLDIQNPDDSEKGSYDFVLCNDVLHDLPDPIKALSEMANLLKPRGKVMLIDLRPHSKQGDNSGDLTAAMFFTCSIFCCLQHSLMSEPRIGYGTCWGVEEMTKAVEAVFNIDKVIHLPMLHVQMVLSKKT